MISKNIPTKDELDGLLLEFHTWKEDFVKPMVQKAFETLSIGDASLLHFTYFEELSMEEISEYCSIPKEDIPALHDAALQKMLQALSSVMSSKPLTRYQGEELMKVAGNSFREHNELAYRQARVRDIVPETSVPSYLDRMADLFATTIDSFVSWAECLIEKPNLAFSHAASSKHTEPESGKEQIAFLITSDGQVTCSIRLDKSTGMCDAYCESKNSEMDGRTVMIVAFSKRSLVADIQEVVIKQQVQMRKGGHAIINGYCLLGRITEDLILRCAVKS